MTAPTSPRSTAWQGWTPPIGRSSPSRGPAGWEGDSSWYVFDGRGAWLGEVSTPPGLSIFEIGADYVLGLRRDQLGVQFVVMLPLDRGSSGG